MSINEIKLKFEPIWDLTLVCPKHAYLKECHNKLLAGEQIQPIIRKILGNVANTFDYKGNINII